MSQRLEIFHATCSQEKDVMRFDGIIFRFNRINLLENIW